LNKPGKLTAISTFTDFGQVELSISNPVSDGSSHALVMTSSGKLLSGAVGDQGLTSLGEIERGVDGLDYTAADKRVVGVRSVRLDRDGRLTSEGALVIGRLDADGGVAAAFGPDQFARRVLGLIRRPCGIELYPR
jgi:hypothetical protein